MAGAVVGKLDEISQSIGALQAETQGLHRTFADHCRDDDRRHEENLAAIRRIADGLDKLTGDRRTIIGGVAVASVFLTVIGGLVWLVAGKVIDWAVTHLKF